MSYLILGIYLVLVGLIQLLEIAVPLWVTGILALIAGLLLLFDNRGVVRNV